MLSDISIGVIGYGYWGPNIVRNFKLVEGACVPIICDIRVDARKRAARDYPDTHIIADCRQVLASPALDAIAIITPVSTHFDLAKEALRNNKHVFIEKPFTSSSEQAKELIEMAASRNLTIMVDHTFLFTGAVKKIKEIVDSGVLGRLLYYDSTRINLGIFQHDVNVIWDLAPHDFAIMDYVLGQNPQALIATVSNHFGSLEDVAFITVYFHDNMIAHFNVNWLSPVKVRLTLLGGEKKTIVWNDIVADEKIRVYDRGVDVCNRDGAYNLMVSYRSGDMWSPRLEQKEALRTEAEYFVKCVTERETPINDGLAGLRVIKMLEMTTQSIRNNSRLTYFRPE